MSSKPFGLADPDEYRGLPLRAHERLADIPLHDVWWVDLPGGSGDVSIEAVRGYLRFESLAQLNPVVRALFALRSFLGRVFGWDSAEASDPPGEDSLGHPAPAGDGGPSRLSEGSLDGPFRMLYVCDREAVGEIRNATVHAFSVMALQPVPGGLRLYWAIYVRPVGRITGAYMALIDPFRRFLVYPAILRHVHRSWLRDHPR